MGHVPWLMVYMIYMPCVYYIYIEIVRMTIPHTPFFDHGTLSYVWAWPNMADHGTVPNNAGLGGENNETPSDFRVPNFWGFLVSTDFG